MAMDWQRISTARFLWHGDEDDGSCDWGRSKTEGVPVEKMEGWDFYYHEPTHWRRKALSDSDAVGQSDGTPAG
jgi:hypothetical protein